TQELRARLDTAQTLTMFHSCERALALACGGWIAGTSRLEDKAELARIAWERSLAGDALPERVFELRFPSPVLDESAGDTYSSVFARAIDAPDEDEFRARLRTLLSDLAAQYEAALADSDPLDDGPSHRILSSALDDARAAVGRLGPDPGSDPG